MASCVQRCSIIHGDFIIHCRALRRLWSVVVHQKFKRKQVTKNDNEKVWSDPVDSETREGVEGRKKKVTFTFAWITYYNFLGRSQNKPLISFFQRQKIFSSIFFCENPQSVQKRGDESMQCKFCGIGTNKDSREALREQKIVANKNLVLNFHKNWVYSVNGPWKGARYGSWGIIQFLR